MSKLKFLILPLVIGLALSGLLGVVGVAAEYLSQESESVTYGETGPFPSTPRSEWVVEWIEEPYLAEDKLYHFSYAVYADVATQKAGDLPFLLNSHKAMVRETHQRMVQPTPGFYRHVSGADVKAEDMQEFLETDPRAYEYTGVDSDGKWTDKDGKAALYPFMFNTYWSDPEALDPQWIRETYQLPLAGQVEELIDRYLAGAAARRLTGDHRGTTLDLQVGANEDDAFEQDNNGGFDRTAAVIVMHSNAGPGIRYNGGHRVIGLTIQGVTIDVMYVIVHAQNTVWDDPNIDIHAEDVDDAVDFIATADVTDRTRTTASAQWTAIGIGAGAVNSPSIVSVGQELADRATFGDNGAVFLLDGRDDAARNFRTDSYEGDSSQALQVHVEYTGVVAARRIILVTEVLPGVTTPILPLLPVPLLLVVGLAGVKRTAV